MCYTRINKKNMRIHLQNIDSFFFQKSAFDKNSYISLIAYTFCCMILYNRSNKPCFYLCVLLKLYIQEESTRYQRDSRYIDHNNLSI